MSKKKSRKDEAQQPGDAELLPPREVMSLLGGPKSSLLDLGGVPTGADPAAAGGSGAPDPSSAGAQPVPGPAGSALSSALGQAQQPDDDGPQTQPTQASESASSTT